MNSPTCLIGFSAAVVSTLFGLGYIVALLANLTGAVEDGPWATA
jgi:hypothetical protein